MFTSEDRGLLPPEILSLFGHAGVHFDQAPADLGALAGEFWHLEGSDASRGPREIGKMSGFGGFDPPDMGEGGPEKSDFLGPG